VNPLVSLVIYDPICGMIRMLAPANVLVRADRLDVGGTFFYTVPEFTIGRGSTFVVQRNATLSAESRKQMRDAGVRLVHDIDDLLWLLPPGHPSQPAMRPLVTDSMLQAMAEADLVTVSTEPLREELAEIGITHVRELPNGLDPHDWDSPPARAPRRKLRIGWHGQVIVHQGDLAFLVSVVRETIDQFEWVFFGGLPDALRDLGDQITVVPSVHIRLFPIVFARLDLDVVLAPLEHNRFNECKSNLRVLQAGALGYASIATDCEAYRGLPVTRVPNESAAWIDALRAFDADHDATRAAGEGLREAVHASYMLDRLAPLYLEAWTGERAASE